MRRTAAVAMVIALATVAPAAWAQSARTASPPQPSRTATLPRHPSTPPTRTDPAVHVLNDGRVVGRVGPGAQRVIPSCDMVLAARRHDRVDPAPQMGTASPVPGARGLPPAPGLSPVPGSRSAGEGSRTTGSTSLKPLHSGWRTAGDGDYGGVCWTHDALGRLRLVHF